MQIEKPEEEKCAQEEPMTAIDAGQIINKVLSFLELFMCGTLAKRVLCMVLIALSISNKRIVELTGLSIRSVFYLKKELRAGEIDSLFHVDGGGRKRKLADVEASVIEEINNNNYHSLQQIVDMVNEKFGIKVSQATIKRLLKKNGIKRLKCGSLPAKADPVEQRKFYDTVLHPLMERAKEGVATLLFMDASHFVMGCDFLGYIYGEARRFVQTIPDASGITCLAH